MTQRTAAALKSQKDTLLQDGGTTGTGILASDHRTIKEDDYDSMPNFQDLANTAAGEGYSVRIDKANADVIPSPGLGAWWSGEWTSGNSYKRGEMVTDDGWLAVANTDDTTDKPAPQATGTPTWVSGFDDNPAWSTATGSTSALFTGQRYTFSSSGYVTGVRLWIPVASASRSYELWKVENPAAASPEVEQIIAPFTATETGWREYALGQQIVVSGTVFDVVLITRNTGTPTTYTFDWNYVRSGNDPTTGQATHASNGASLKIHHEDDGATSRQTELESLAPGDKIAAGGLEWSILSATADIDFVDFLVEPAARLGSNSLLTFTLTKYATASISYVNVANHYVADSEVDGIYSTSGYDSIATDDDAYGVDLQVQAATVSSEWDLIAALGAIGSTSSAAPELIVTGISSSTTVTQSSRFFEIDATSGDVTVTLPAATAAVIYEFKRVDETSNAVVIDGNGTNIDSEATQELSPWDCLSVRYSTDQSQWLVCR